MASHFFEILISLNGSHAGSPVVQLDDVNTIVSQWRKKMHEGKKLIGAGTVLRGDIFFPDEDDERPGFIVRQYLSAFKEQTTDVEAEIIIRELGVILITDMRRIISQSVRVAKIVLLCNGLEIDV